MGSLRVEYDAVSAARVRHEIAAELHARSVARESADDVVLVASELVGNAVTHASGSERLEVSWVVDADCVTVVVRDGTTGRPAPRQAAPDATGGRGLAIVAAVASDWGVRPDGDGKQVWAQVPVRFER